MRRMKQVYVALEYAGASHPVGVIRFDVDKNFGLFTYLASYQGPPLDPIHLNYRKPMAACESGRRHSERVFVVDPAATPGLLHSVFVDSMPGQWGLSVLMAEYPEIREMRDCERLYWMGARTVGALSFFVDVRGDERPVRGLENLKAVQQKCDEFLLRLRKMGLKGVRNPAVASHGGIMPKASYEDDDGVHWLAKFDRPGSGLQYAALEQAACEMARACGIDIPTTTLLDDAVQGATFLAQRFDRSADGRSHRISFMSLLGARDIGQGDYGAIFNALRAAVGEAAWPAQRDQMLRRMVFNIGLNVTDDHLRNHELLLNSAGQWELTPAFDLMPSAGQAPHQCGIFGQGRACLELARDDMHALWGRVALEIGCAQEHVLGIVQEIGDAIKELWPELVRDSHMNSFNQMHALMAAEVGCGAAFSSDPLRARPQARAQAEGISDAPDDEEDEDREAQRTADKPSLA